MPTQLVSPTPAIHVGKQGGMNYSTPPHLLPEEQWRVLSNIRQSWSLEQARRLSSLVSAGSYPVVGLAAVPVPTSNRALWLAWDYFNMYRVTSSGVTVLDTKTGTPWSQMSLWKYNDFVFYCSDSQPKFTDGAVAYNVWHDRCCWTKHNASLAVGDGAFAPHPFYHYVGEVLVFDDDLGNTFDWITGEQYRVYLQKPHLFPPGTSIKIERAWCDEELTPTSTLYTLTGLVLETQTDYCVVYATNTQADVPNYGPQLGPALADPPWLVTATNMATVPEGRYCAVFFDHLVVAGLVNNRNKVAWSDVNDFADFLPRSDNEADSFICTECQRPDDITTGITGLQRLGDSLLIFTPGCVYQMTYTGLPRVMHVRPLLRDVGNGLPHASVALADSVMWFDVHHGTFLQFSESGGLQNAGGPIMEYFVEQLTTNAINAKLTTAFVDRESSEVGWIFLSDDDGSGVDYSAWWGLGADDALMSDALPLMSQT